MLVLSLLLAIELPVKGEDNPRHIEPPPGIETVKTLEQNWTDETSNWFYNVPQGSRLVPYVWFLNLEQSGAETQEGCKRLT
jgi:hypothetical protein